MGTEKNESTRRFRPAGGGDPAAAGNGGLHADVCGGRKRVKLIGILVGVRAGDRWRGDQVANSSVRPRRRCVST